VIAGGPRRLIAGPTIVRPRFALRKLRPTILPSTACGATSAKWPNESHEP
jgi:hypothetical protein